MAHETTLYKLAIKASYKATLAPYARMDSVAIGLTSDLPQWQRSALSVELWNHESKSAFQMHFNNCYFECDWPDDVLSRVRSGSQCLDSSLKKFEVNKLERLGAAFFFIAPRTELFRHLVVRCDKAFHRSFDSIPAFDDYELHDTAYSVSAKDKNSGWIYTVLAGPMTKSEFLNRYPLNLRLYDLERHSVNHYRDQIPETLLFCSVDAGRIDCDRNQAMANLPDVAKRCLKISEQLFSKFAGDGTNGGS